MSIRLRILLCWLLISYLLSSCRPEVTIAVIADFDYELIDSNYSVPVTIGFTNKSKGALFYHWTFSEGDRKESKSRNPGYLLVDKPGLIKVKLEVWNDYERSEKTIEIKLDTLPVADFSAVPIVNEFAPAEYNFQFTGQGATNYKWLFENGSPAVSTERNPSQIKFIQQGTFKITLIISNDRNRADTILKTVLVKPEMIADFTIVPSFEDDDYEVPFNALLQNQTLNATQFSWTCDGAVMNKPQDSLPLLQITNPGIYTVVYTASNQKQTQVIRKTIQVNPNSRLRSFQNIHLGINTAHKETGSFFSTYLRKIVRKDSVNTLNGPFIDICYFGLNRSFSYNKFISPVDVQTWTFNAIPGATVTTFVNNQEKCNCTSGLNPLEFDQISNGSYFDNILVPAVAEGTMEFDQTVLPRIILFKNAAGKKGAIKIKEFVDNGDASYIICDIKVQKD